jgi:hypothetical protein
MTVKELIANLQSMPQNMEVYASKSDAMPTRVTYVHKSSDLEVVVIYYEKS